MNGVKRRAAMARFIDENDGADVQTLADYFQVSPITVRRDRKILAEQNMLSPTHGGAVPASFLYGELAYAQKVNANIPSKKAIARRAAELVRDDSVVMLDAGTTTLELAKLLMHRRLTIITVDLQIALHLSQSSTVRVFTPGGEVNREVQGQLDSRALRYLQEANAAISFIGTATWDAVKGVSSSNVPKQEIKRTLMERAECTYLLADSAKYGTYNPWSVAPLKNFDGVISDGGLSPLICKDIFDVGAELILA